MSTPKSRGPHEHSSRQSEAARRKRGLIVGIANDKSIAWGCAKAFRAFGAELAVTYLNDKAEKYVEPLARELEAPIVMPLDVTRRARWKRFSNGLRETWGNLDFVVHSIAFSPKDALHGRVVDVPRDGFLTTMDVSCWSFIRMAHLAEPLMRKGGTLFTMTYYGSQMVVKNYNIMGVAKAALESRFAIWLLNSVPREFAFTRSLRARLRRAPLRAFRNSTSCSKKPSQGARAQSRQHRRRGHRNRLPCS